MRRLLFLGVGLSLFTGCSTIPPNTIEIKIESTPSAAVIYSPAGKMMGLTPLTLYYPLSQSDISSGVVRGGNSTAVWCSGARAVTSTDFRLNGLTSATVTFSFDRPMDTPGVLQDIEFAEARSRRDSEQSQAGWEALADVIAGRNRQKASLPPIRTLELSPAPKPTASWTGGMKNVTTITYQQGVSCEYNYAGRIFWRTFVGGSCPSAVEVQ